MLIFPIFFIKANLNEAINDKIKNYQKKLK